MEKGSCRLKRLLWERGKIKLKRSSLGLANKGCLGLQSHVVVQLISLMPKGERFLVLA